MTDSEINEYVNACISDWIKAGASWETMLAIGCGIAGSVCQVGEIPNEKAHEALASVLTQRQQGRP